LHELHDSKASAHLGRKKTAEKVAQLCWWPGMTDYVRLYIRHCHACHVMKAGHKWPAGLLRPLHIPYKPWSLVSMDLVIGLPPSSHGNDYIYVVVDRFTKMCHFEACSTAISVVQLAELFTKMCGRHHNMPEEIVSDRDPRFTAKFSQIFRKSIGTNLPGSMASGHVLYLSPTYGRYQSHSGTDAHVLRRHTTE
jgi:hypothetical protein